MFKIKILSIFSLLILASSLSTCTKKGETTTTTTNNPTSSDITTTTTTEKQKQNIEGITFQDQSVAYDGEEHSIYITGDLPTGVTVTYENNGKIEIGEYKVVASFTDSTGLYNVPENMEATLTIYDDTVYYDLVFNFDDDKQEYKLEAGTLFTEVPKIPDKLGYEAKWDYDFANPIIDNTEVNILYTAINYGITYHLDGGTNNENNQDTYTILDDILLEEPTKKGYTFTGWYSDSSLETEVTSISNETGNKELYARWEANQYKVSYYIADYYFGEETVTYDEEFDINKYTYSPNPGYSISSWTDGETVYNNGNKLTYTVDHDLVLQAYDVYYNEVFGVKFNYTVDNNAMTLKLSFGLNSSYSESDTLFIIPTYIISSGKTYKLTQMGVACYASLSIKNQYTSIFFPHSLTEITNASFHEWTNLVNVTISNGVSRIAGSSFTGCDRKKEIFIPKSVTSVGGNPFNGCDGIEKITVDPNNPYYDSRDNCNAVILTSENKLVVGCNKTIIPESVEKIGSFAFDRFTNIKSIYIHKGIKKVDDGAFRALVNLETIEVDPNNEYYTSLNNNAIFEIMTNDEYHLVVGCKNTIIAEKTVSIAPNAFYECSGLTNINIPEGLTSIGGYAFQKCINLKAVSLPETLISLGNYAFSDCSSLEEITIPSSVTSISSSVFNNCTSLVKATVNSIKVGSSMFQNCTNLETVVLGDNVEEIGQTAFALCTKLKNITLPSGLKTILDNAFDCNSMTYIVIPESVTKIGLYAFDSGITIYCESTSKLSGWNSSWCTNNCTVYYQGQWEFIEGVPTVKENE